MTQAEITMNIKVNLNMHRTRQAVIAECDPEEYMSADLGDNCSYLDIEFGDMIVVQRREIPITGFERLQENRATGFASFNGMWIPNRHNISNHHFQRRFKVIGLAGSSARFGTGKYASNEGVSVRVAGSMSMFNRSREEFFIGDPVTYRFHHIDRRIREKEIANLPESDKYPRNKLTPILGKLRYEDGAHMLHSAITESFQEDNANMRDVSVLLDQDRAEAEDERVRVALAMRLFVQLVSFIAVSTLADYGLVEIRTPNRGGEGNFAMSYGKWQNVEELSPVDTARGVVNYDPLSNKLSYTDQITDKDKKRKINERAFLAGKLGLYQDEQMGGLIAPASSIIEGIVGRAYNPYLLDPELTELTSLEHMFPSEFLNPLVVGAKGLNTLYNSSNPSGQLCYAQALAAPAFHMCHARAMDMLYETVFAHAMSHTIGGGKLDIFF